MFTGKKFLSEVPADKVDDNEKQGGLNIKLPSMDNLTLRIICNCIVMFKLPFFQGGGLYI